MNRRTVILAITAGAAVALGGLTTLTHSHAQTSPATASPVSPTTAAVAPTTASTTRSTGSESSRFSDRRGSSSSDERGSRRFGNGGSSSSSFPVHELTGTKYADLETRSIFVKGRYTHGSDQREYRPTPPYAVTPVSPEHTLVFEGATEFDYDFVAFVEDQSSNKVMMLKSGDPVARGRVGQITLNYMDYIDKAGKTVKVAIGKNLEGMDPPSTQPTYTSSYSSSPYSSSPSSSPSSTPPSSYSSTPSSSTPSVAPSSSGGIMSPADAAAERLRRRRQAELGGGGGR